MLHEVLLIDDYEADNFLHRMVLEEMGCAETISEKNNGREALNYLTTEVDGQLPSPDLIFLDINMPVMNGWEFLDAYAGLPQDQRRACIVAMLTTSQNPGDLSRVESSSVVSEYLSKPLTEDAVRRILEVRFAHAE